ncbi:protein of unknown function [Flavobacterium fluvii]|uniref:DUF4957 domain-containing protein n=1 Tax=Flavobacterium fluvii TaxID=468056 RepID=A0A1M5LPW9_9FLAO|nr:DUF4957 domain-containing protein [Flavobacterium fluvii]SHG67075.1 protein of unknown function [Flavobacterium fluvii]
MKKNNLFKALLLLVGVLYLNSCSVETYPETRLFRPVLNKDLLALNNTITVDMGKLKSAVYYKIEVSRDTFKTVLKTFDTPENKFVITDLLWNTLYQVRATAFAEKEEFNSKISNFGGVKTEKFPTIMLPQTAADVTDIAVKVRWLVAAGDQAVTAVKVFAGADEALTTPLATYPTTPAEIAAGAKIISGLTPGTKYQVAIYSGETIRGWDLYTTKPAIPTTGNVIDLRGKTDPNLLITTLKDPATTSGSTIILDGDMTYNGTGYSFDKSITIKSGYSTSSNGAIINITSNFSLAAGSVISSIVFDGVTLMSANSAAIYIFNVNASATVENLKFDNCRISSFRGVFRSQGAANVGYITNYSINNSIVTDIRGYGVITLEPVAWKFSNIAFTNSTFYKCEKFISTASTVPAKSILISDCTLNEVARISANKIFAFPATAGGNVTDGITIANTIIGRGWDTNGTGATSWPIDPIDGLTATNFTVNNSFSTSDFTLTTGGTPIPGFPNVAYAKTTVDLWKNPANGKDPAIADFNFIDSSFAGIKTAGDPRWRKQ